MTTPTGCNAERSGPYPVLCRLPSGHIGGHYGYYQGRPYNWDRAKTRFRRIAIEFPAEVECAGLVDQIAEVALGWENFHHPKRDWDVNVYATTVEVEDE